MNYTNYKQTYLRGRIDGDRYPTNAPYQCTDLTSHYVDNVWQIPGNTIFPVPNGAKQIIERHSEYFDTVLNDWNKPEQIPQQGDIVVFGATPGNAYGHVGIIDSANQEYMMVLEQNGGQGQGQGQGEDAINVHKRTYQASGGCGSILGWLHLKTTSNMQEQYTQLLANQTAKGLKFVNQGQEWTGRLQGLINAGDYFTFTKEMMDTLVFPETGEALPAESAFTEALAKKDEEIAALKQQLANATLTVVSAEEIADLTVEKLSAKFWSNAGQFVPKPAWLEAALGAIKNNSTAITAIATTYLMMSEGDVQKIISGAIAAISLALSIWLEWDKTKYNQAKNNQ